MGEMVDLRFGKPMANKVEIALFVTVLHQCQISTV